jgi:hypothetical protein
LTRGLRGILRVNHRVKSEVETNLSSYRHRARYQGAVEPPLTVDRPSVTKPVHSQDGYSRTPRIYCRFEKAYS